MYELTKSFDTHYDLSWRCLNRATLITQGDVHLDGTIAKPWRLCKVQEVEDFKSLLKIFPLWSSSIFLSIPIEIQGSLTVLQALTMDHHLDPNFKILAGSFSVIIVFISTTMISLTQINWFLYPIWQKSIGRMPQPLERIGLDHVLNFLSMVVSSLVEPKSNDFPCPPRSRPSYGDSVNLILVVFPITSFGCHWRNFSFFLEELDCTIKNFWCRCIAWQQRWSRWWLALHIIFTVQLWSIYSIGLQNGYLMISIKEDLIMFIGRNQ